MDFITNNWEVILATLGCAVGGIAVPGIRTFVMLGVRSMLQKKFLHSLLFQLLKKLLSLARTQWTMLSSLN